MIEERNILPCFHVRELCLNEDIIMITTLTLNYQQQK